MKPRITITEILGRDLAARRHTLLPKLISGEYCTLNQTDADE